MSISPTEIVGEARRARAAEVIADALREIAAQTATVQRMYLPKFLGFEPDQIFDALQVDFGPEPVVSIKTPQGNERLYGITVGDAVLVPYLVTSSGKSLRPNSGAAGFAAKLRDLLQDTDDGRPLFYLVLASDPADTVLTAADDCRELPQLNWKQLVKRAINSAPAPPPSTSLVISDVLERDRVEHTGEKLGAILELLLDSKTDSELGSRLWELGCYIADPKLALDPPSRLRLSAMWRERLDKWSAPGEDFVERLAANYGNTNDPGFSAVVNAATAFGIQFGGFDLDDLPKNQPKDRLGIARPMRIHGAGAIANDSGISAWLPGGGTFALLLTGTPSPSDRAYVQWASGSTTEVVIDAGRRELRITCESLLSNWVYGTLVVNESDRIPVAIYTNTGTWFPVGATFEIDAEAQCFRFEGEPRVVAVDSSGAVIGAPALAALGDIEAGEPVEYEAIYDSEAHRISLLDVGNLGESPDDGDDHGPEGGEGQEDEDSPGEENEELGGSDTGQQKTPTSVSVVHAKLEVARERPEKDLGAVSFGVADGEGFIIVGGAPRNLAQQKIGVGGLKLDGLSIEAVVLSRPDVLTHIAALEEGQLNLQPDPLLERLHLDDLGGSELEEFWAAREAFFSAVGPYGSVHAIAAGVGVREAHRYVQSYGQLLDTAAQRGPFHAEYRRLLLCDAIRFRDGKDLFLAPSNPVTVAFLLRFDEVASSWLASADQISVADLKSCTPQHLLPTFSIDLPGDRSDDSWFEVAGDTPLLWRRYQPLSAAGGGTESDSGYILRRLRHFLQVFPDYRDERQTLALSFIEPGDGQAVLSALRSFYRPLSRVANEAPPKLPNLDVTVIAFTRPETLERAMSITEDEVDSVLRDRVSLTVRTPEKKRIPSEQQTAFSHITFITRSPLEKKPGTIDFSTRASTLYVHGLAAAPGRETLSSRNDTQFSWGLFPGRTPTSADSLEGLVRSSLEIVGGMPQDQIIPNQTKMPSARVAAEFLTEIYSSSIWIVHLDRLLGLEAFTPSIARKFHRYLIDYEDRSSPGRAGLDAITATERVAPYHLALRKAMHEIGNVEIPAVDRILNLLNSANGKWALNLLGSNVTQVRERIGVVAALLALDNLDSAFQANDQSISCVIALDELLDQLPTDGRKRPVGKHCDDLLVLSLPLAEGTVKVSGRLVEVKYRVTADPDLPGAARLQLEATHKWLHQIFNDLSPSRLFRSRDLAQLLRSGFARGQAFGLIRDVDAAEFRDAMESALERVSFGDYELDLSFDVGNDRFHGELVSVEATSDFSAHRSQLPGTGQKFSYLRLGRPVLQALAANIDLTRPLNFESSSVPSKLVLQADDELSGESHKRASGTQGAVPSEADETASAPDGGESERSPEEPLPPSRSTDPAHDPETQRIAMELTNAAGQHALNLEPFDPARAEIGPGVIRLRTKLLGRQTLSGLQSRSLDLAREVGASEALLIDQEPYYVTVDVPRAHRETVLYRDYADRLDTQSEPGALNFLLGMAPNGDVRIADVARLPHLLVAGSTGSGKSVFLRCLVSSLVRTRNPSGLRLIICDPQTVNYAPFEGLPHLIEGRVLTEPLEMVELLTNTLGIELDQRRATLRTAHVTSALEFYEEGGHLEELPQMVIVIDEFADLVDVLQKDAKAAFLQAVKRFAQMARALGIYLVLATQRPSATIITGDIKANLTARVALKMLQWQDSMTILGRKGAESLRKDGDLLFDHAGSLEHLQGFLCEPSDAYHEAERWQ